MNMSIRHIFTAEPRKHVSRIDSEIQRLEISLGYINIHYIADFHLFIISAIPQLWDTQR
jgi:hypothetical protein